MRPPRTELNLTEWIVLALACEAPMHGWTAVRELRRESPLGQVWSTSGPLVYRAVARLQEAGLLQAVGTAEGQGPNRVILDATDEGRELIRAWLLEPVEHVRDVRTVLLAKLLLSERRGIDTMGLVEDQRERLRPIAASLAERAATATGPDRIVATWRALNADATIRFLDALEPDRTMQEAIEMPIDPEDLRLAIYTSVASTGRAPDTADLAASLGADAESIKAGLRELAAARHLALDADGEVVLAHPFSTIDLGFSVKGTRTLWWGGCVWDSFAIPHLVPDEPEVLVATTCQGCGRAHAWVVGREGPPAGDQVAHFLVPAARLWDDVVHSCSNQRVFCNDGCLDAWLDRERLERGFATDLATVWRLASGWYAGRLDRGYVRREPSAAQAYLRGAGLSGAFWGL